MQLFIRKTVKRGFVLMVLLCTAGHTTTDMLDLYMMGILPAIIANQNKVVDKEKPVLTLVGEERMNLQLDDTYDEEGATCEDNSDKTCSVVIGGDTVDTSTVGTYVVTYNATDSSGNEADELTRTVTVEDSTLVVDDFAFVDEIGVEYNTWVSASMVVGGLEAEVNVSISSSGYEGEASHSYFTVNDETDVTEVKNGDVVEVRHISSNEYNTTLNTVITIGTKSDTFSSKTKLNGSVKLPLIVGAPNSNANVHEVYSYLPQLSTNTDNFAPATKPFSIENRPQWATFDTATGELSGTPTQTAVHHNIKISAYGDNGMDSIVYDLRVESNPPYINPTDLSLENPDLVLTFNENADWRSKVTTVLWRSCYEQTEAVILDPADYTFAEGTLTLHASNSANVALHIPTMGGGGIEVVATDYENNATGIIDYIVDGQYAIHATVSASESLTELNVDNQILVMNLSNYLEFNDSSLDAANFNTWDSDIMVSSVVYVSPTEANLTLAFNGNDFDTNKTLEIYVNHSELNVCQDVSSNGINVEAMIEVPKNILKTGVMESLVAGDDANYSKGQNRSYAYTDNVDSKPVAEDIVRDNIIGLQWQDDMVVTVEEYNSYGGDTNWTKANNYCANLSLAGYDDWRLANNEELLTLIDYGRSYLAVDGIFKHIGSVSELPDNYGHWSADAYVGDNSFAWTINLASGELHYSGKISQYNVKCVRSVLSQNQFSRDDEDKIVKDVSTNLKWQDNNSTIQAETLVGAIAYCNDLVIGEESNWRVPNVNELLTITDYSNTPVNVVDAFENTNEWYYYTSTQTESNSSKYWFVHFGNGGGTYQLAEGNYNIRCVSEDNPPAHPTAWIKVINGTDTDEDPDHVTVGVELHGTSFADDSVSLIQQNGHVSATGGYVYVDSIHAYIEENIENLEQDEPMSWTVHESEIMHAENITSNTIMIHPESNESEDANGTVTVGALMWEDTEHVRGGENNVTWSQANTYCDDLELASYYDWRLPHHDYEEEINELGTIMTDSNDTAIGDDRVINEPFILITVNDNIWSWTDEGLGEEDTEHVMGIFSGGPDNFDGMGNESNLSVRCVRDIE